MRTTNLLLVSALAFAGLGACTTYAGEQAEASAGETEIMLKGNLVYRERIALPPGSTAIVSLEDVSLADAPSPTIASQTIELDGRQIPIPFMLDVDADELSSRGRYSLRATIHGPDGNLAWTTDTARLFDPAAGDRDFGDVRLVRVAGSGSS
ncbi:MAG TPA: lipo-like protein, partial [Erythrobacter sp.]|nr:lipo-like protein [Erythrobacter sp.]